MSRRFLSALLILLAVALAGCSSSPTVSTGTTSTTSLAPGTVQLEAGGTAVVAVSSLPTNFNPLSPPGANRITNEVMAGVWPHAFVTDQRFQQLLEPDFVLSAEVYGVSPFTVVYKLNPRAVWSDGVPITTADFVYDWHEELQFAPLLPDAGLVAGYRAISSMSQSPDGHTLTVVFKQPFSEWESLFSTIVPAHVAEKYGWVAAFQGFSPDRLVSGGPFMVSSFQPGRQLVLVRNPRFWGAPAHLSRIVLQVESSSAALAGLETGSVSMAEVPPGDAVTNTVARAAEKGVALTDVVGLSPTLWQLCFNTNDSLLSSLTLRSALVDSLDVAGVTADSAGFLDWVESADPSRLSVNGEPGGGGATPVTYDQPAAVKLYQQAGFALGTDGAMRVSGTGSVLALKLLIPSGMPLVAAAADAIAGQLQAIGVRVAVSAVPLSQLLASVLPSGAYQLAIAPFLVTTYPAGMAAVYTPAQTSASLPWSLATPLDSPTGKEPGAANAGVVTRDITGLNDPIVTNDFIQALQNLNFAVSQSLLQKANQQMWVDLATVPLFQQPQDLVHRSSLTGPTESPTWAGPFWNVQDWAWQLSPPVPVPTFPGISSVSPIGPTQVVG